MQIPEIKQKIENKFFVFYIIAFEFGVTNSRHNEEDTCHRQSMC